MATIEGGPRAEAYEGRKKHVAKLAQRLARSGSTMTLTAIARQCRIDTPTARGIIKEMGLERVLEKR